jgi:hypothetical protein
MEFRPYTQHRNGRRHDELQGNAEIRQILGISSIGLPAELFNPLSSGMIK